MKLSCAAALISLHALAASAGASRGDPVGAILNGEGPVFASVERIRFSGEASSAARALGSRLSQGLEVGARRRAVEALGLLAQVESEGDLVKAASDVDSSVRVRAAEGLGRLKSVSNKSVAALSKSLVDKVPEVRRAAALSLGQVRSQKAGRALVRAAGRETEVENRAVMLVAAGLSGDVAMARALVPYLRDDTEGVRLAAAQGLCILGHPAGRAVAQARLASTSQVERLQGVLLFEGARARVSGPSLRPLLTDGDSAVAATAGRVLYEGGDPSLLAWLVRQSEAAMGADKKPYFEALNALKVTEADRYEILSKAGP